MTTADNFVPPRLGVDEFRSHRRLFRLIEDELVPTADFFWLSVASALPRAFGIVRGNPPSPPMPARLLSMPFRMRERSRIEI